MASVYVLYWANTDKNINLSDHLPHYRVREQKAGLPKVPSATPPRRVLRPNNDRYLCTVPS